MPNDDGLKEFIQSRIALVKSDVTPEGYALPLSPDLAKQLAHWLSELLTAREYIPILEARYDEAKQLREKIAAIEHGIKFYINRNIELIDQYQGMKKSLECWVTRAGALEAKLRKQNTDDAEREYLTSRLSDLADKLDEKDELLWWVTAAVESYRHIDYSYQGWVTAWDALGDAHQMLATQGYTREELEKR